MLGHPLSKNQLLGSGSQESSATITTSRHTIAGAKCWTLATHSGVSFDDVDVNADAKHGAWPWCTELAVCSCDCASVRLLRLPCRYLRYLGRSFAVEVGA